VKKGKHRIDADNVQTSKPSNAMQNIQHSNTTPFAPDDEYLDDELDDDELMNIQIADDENYLLDDEELMNIPMADEEDYLLDDDIPLEDIELDFDMPHFEKKPKLVEYEIQDCKGASGVRWVKGFVFAHSKLVCRNGFQLNVVLSNEIGAELNVVMENDVCMFELVT
jgi:hypothetical protein